MKLQFLIPQYKETDEVVKPLLDSIALQQNVDMDDIGVIIANDGTDVKLSDELINGYPFEIKYLQCEHRGVSATRNACLDAATADYVMFCDADDMFYNMCGIWLIFREIETQGDFDSLTSVFVEETKHPETKAPEYINREMDSTFVHGKVHRRKYLINNNIRWNDNLTIHEDSYFNILAQNCSQNVKYCMTPFYLWRWRDESVCRHDPKYILKTFNNMIDSNDALIEQFIDRGMEDKAGFYVCFMTYDAYYLMNKPEWKDQENQEYRLATEKRFAKYFRKYRKFWDNMGKQEKMQISNGVRQRQVMEGMEMEIQTLKTWLDYILELEEDEKTEN